MLATPDRFRLPIIEIEAQAPDAMAAAGLAKAAITGLSDYLDSKAATEKVQDAERLRVTGLGSPQAREVVRGPRLMFAIAAALFVFGAGCDPGLLGVIAQSTAGRRVSRGSRSEASSVRVPTRLA